MAHHYEQLSNFGSPVVWVKCSKGQLLPKGLSPVFGGLSVENGEPTYVARALHQGNLIPGRLVPSSGTCYVGHGLTEHAYTESYQVLTKPDGTRLEWVLDKDGHVPDGAVVGGQQADGTKLYIGRVYHDGFGVCGKVHREHKTLYIALNGKEHPIKKYQVLALYDPLKWIDCEDGQVPVSPLNPVMSGVTADGEPTYVARARHETRHYQGGSGQGGSGHPACTGVSRPHNGTRSTRSSSSSSIYSSREIVRSHLIPGRLVPSQKKCYVGHGSKEHSYSRYQVLTNPFRVQLEWMPARGHVPDGALLGGQAGSLKYYIGRVYHDGFAISGKIYGGSKDLRIATGGKEWHLQGMNKYEVLVDIEKMANTNQQLLNHGVTM